MLFFYYNASTVNKIIEFYIIELLNYILFFVLFFLLICKFEIINQNILRSFVI
jgi:hypothetical protein